MDLAENIVTRVAEAAGFGEDDLHKVLGNNWLRVFRAVNEYSSHTT